MGKAGSAGWALEGVGVVEEHAGPRKEGRTSALHEQSPKHTEELTNPVTVAWAISMF